MQTLILGDCLSEMKRIESDSINTIITSPPYNKKGLSGGKVTLGNQVWKKFNIDYSTYDDNLSEQDYQLWMIEILNEMMRIIKPNGSIFFNHKPRRHNNRVYLPTDFISKSDLEIYQLIIWNRLSSPNIRKDVLLPCTEHIYWLTKGKPKTFKDKLDKEYHSEIWTINPDKGNSHPAPFPEKLVENCILLSTDKGDLVFDPFLGSGTTAVVSRKLGRDFIGVELDESYLNLSKNRLNNISQ
jgi:site-specific DNA-methyltransferase (adenine-specific)